MAATAALAKVLGENNSNPPVELLLDITLDNSYPTGGYVFDALAEAKSLAKYDSSINEVLFVTTQQKDGFTVEYVDDPVPANRRLKVIAPAGAEVANTTDLSTTPGVLRVGFRLS